MDHAEDQNRGTLTLVEGGSGGRCAICGRRQRQPMRRLVDAELVSDDLELAPRSWVVCSECAEAVQQEVERAGLHTPQRVRVAVGIVAADRHPQRRPSIFSDRYWEELDDTTISKMINRFVLVLIVVKTLAFIAVIVLVAHVH
jgi:hypothetical protein